MSAFSLPDLICDRTELKINLYRVVFRVEFDGDVHFCIALQKSTVLSIFLNIFMIFRFSDFSKFS